MHDKAKKEYMRLLVQEAVRNSKLPYNDSAMDTIVKFAEEHFYVSDATGDVVPSPKNPVAFNIKDFVENYLPATEKYLLQRPEKQTKMIYPQYPKAKELLTAEELWKIVAQGVEVSIDDPRTHL